MNDLLKWLALCAAILMMVFVLNDHDTRIVKLEAGPSCRADCVPIQHLLSNRPYPPPAGAKHSFARPFRTCEEP